MYIITYIILFVNRFWKLFNIVISAGNVEVVSDVYVVTVADANGRAWVRGVSAENIRRIYIQNDAKVRERIERGHFVLI